MGRALWSRWVVALVLVGTPVIWGLVKWRHDRALVVSLIVYGIFWVLVLLLLEWAGRKDGNPKRSKYGFVNVVIGADGRV